MGHRLFASWAVNLPLLPFLLLVLFIALFVFFEIRERVRARRAVLSEIQSRVQAELGNLIGDILRRTEEAHQQLSALGALQVELTEQKRSLDVQFASVKEESEKHLTDIRSIASDVLRLAPTRGDLDWIAPEALLRLAAQAPDWPTAAGYLTRIDRENATSRDLEGAGDICRDRAVYVKALEFYKEASDKDPDNHAARTQLLALTAEMRPAERVESLRALQELLAQNLASPVHGAKMLTRYCGAIMDLGRHKELIEFGEAQLKLPLPRYAQLGLHRHLAICLQKLGRSEEALAHCEAALKICADDTEVLSLYGHLLLSARKYEEAYRAAIRVLQRNPASARNYIVLARIQERRIGRPAARDLLKKALQWADGNERFEIEDYQGKLAALDDFAQILPATQPQIIQA